MESTGRRQSPGSASEASEARYICREAVRRNEDHDIWLPPKSGCTLLYCKQPNHPRQTGRDDSNSSSSFLAYQVASVIGKLQLPGSRPTIEARHLIYQIEKFHHKPTSMPTPFDNTKFSSAPALETLPNELLLQIISEVVLSSTWPDYKLEQSLPITGTNKMGWKGLRRAEEIPSGIHAVTLTSRHLHNLANTVLYRTIVLDKEKDVLLFRRTVDDAQKASRPGRTGKVAITPDFLRNVVKRLAITHAPMHTDLAVFTSRKLGTKVSNSDIATIITACSRAHVITIPSQWAHVLRDIGKAGEGSERGEAPGNPDFTELLLSSYVDLAKTCSTIPPIAQWRPSAPSTPIHSLPVTPSTTRPSTPDPTMQLDLTGASGNSPATVFHHVTHLCIAEPAHVWYSPLALLEVFPSLTHIALPRPAHANTENDELFIGDVKAILQRPMMQVVVIIIFPQIRVGADKEQAVNRDVGGPPDIKESTIWLAVEELRKGDGRLFVVNGHSGSWRKDWQGPSVVASPRGPGNWWKKVMNA